VKAPGDERTADSGVPNRGDSTRPPNVSRWAVMNGPFRADAQVLRSVAVLAVLSLGPALGGCDIARCAACPANRA